MLILYDEAGNVTFDGSRRTIKTFGILNIGGAGTAQSGTLVDDRFLMGEPFYFITKPTGASSNAATHDDVEVSIQGNVMTWRYPRADNSVQSYRPLSNILYGIF